MFSTALSLVTNWGMFQSFKRQTFRYLGLVGIRKRLTLPRQTTPSPVYPGLQAQVLSPPETFVHTANSEHPPLDLLHKSTSGNQRRGQRSASDGFHDMLNVCFYLCRRFHFPHIQRHKHKQQQLIPEDLKDNYSRRETLNKRCTWR